MLETLENLTWTCHVCGRSRPDDKISVTTKPLIINGQVVGNQNIRYCNDNPKCINEVQDYTLIKE